MPRSRDPTLLIAATVAEAWRIVVPIEQVWDEGRPPLVTYPAGRGLPTAGRSPVPTDARHGARPVAVDAADARPAVRRALSWAAARD
jgi:hypothetical protein